MDPTNSYLGRLLLEEITPVVMVLSTPLAEEACQKNGFNFVQMLHPFCAFNNIDVPVRTANDQPYRLQMFKLRFFYASEICRQDQEVAVKHLREVISNASEKSMSDLQFDPPQLESLLSMSEPEIVPPWCHIFNRDLSRSLSFSDHEAFDHPIACLLVVSSEDEQPMNKFVDLFNTNQLPSLLSDSAMDPKILKNYLLLHDRQHGAMEKASGILAEMRSTFGLNDCKLLCINSMKDESMVWNENPWSHYRASTSQEGIACCLNIDDLNEIKDFMQDLSSKKIIPHMEQKIRILNQQVSVTRKGFKNQIKNLWWRKGKEDAPDTPNGPVYTYSSIESQMRVLGDYSFMLRDYELALSNYRLLSTDYKLDKAWKRYAGVQEMMGLSLFMLDQSRKDSEYCMETAFSTYLRTDSSGLKNAVRCGLWWAEMLKARGQHKDAAGVYFRLSSEELSLHAAVMLEQASYCYLFSRPPMIRKFGFHLVLAGNQYYMSDQKKHAIRAYRIALSVYRENVWSYINDHVHFNIGRWYALFEMFDAATKHMLKVIECTHQPPTTQDLILKDFLHIVQNMGRNFEVPKLHLPSINLSSLKVIFEDNRTYASPDAIGVKENTWHSFEENMVPSIATVRSNWLESRKLHSSKKYNGSSASAVGEAIKVFFELKNPLKVTLSVSGLSLVCEHSVRPAEDSDSTSINELQNSVVLGWSPSSRDTKEHSSFVLSELDFDMVGGETREVQLHVTPKIEGILKIVGVKWMLSELLVGYHKFDLDKRKKIKKGRETDGSLMNNMTFIVVKGLPKLECSIHHLPRKAYLGDLRLLALELRNQSEYSVKNMKMVISHPRILVPGRSGNLALEFPSCLHKQLPLKGKDEHIDTWEKPGGLFSFPSDIRVPGGGVFQWPLWLHCAIAGKNCVYISIYYEMDNITCDMNYRLLRICHEMEVLPSLDVSISINPCPNKLQEFLVRMEVASKTSTESFWLHQLSSVGSRWKISSLPGHASVCNSQLLLAGQALLCFFKLKDCGHTSSKEGGDLKLGSQEGNETLVDISSSPLADFHYHERLQQGKSIQEDRDTVDFILISQLVEDGANPAIRDQVQLLSHHACHRSITSKNPIWWLMDGPRTIYHDFSVPFCEANFHLTIYNCSEAVVSLKISTFDSTTSALGQAKDSSPRSDSSANQTGWHDVSFDVKLANHDLSASRLENSLTETTTTFVWCASSSTQAELGPLSTVKVPLRICIFSPGICNLSNYEIQWSLQLTDVGGSVRDVLWKPSGSDKGHPFYLTVLQSSDTHVPHTGLLH